MPTLNSLATSSDVQSIPYEQLGFTQRDGNDGSPSSTCTVRSARRTRGRASRRLRGAGLVRYGTGTATGRSEFVRASVRGGFTKGALRQRQHRQVGLPLR